MSTRFRLFIITLGALLVAAVYTFPRWLPLVAPQQAQETAQLLPGLNPALEAAFALLPADQQRAYLELPDLQVAAAMANAALSPAVPVPEDEQSMPAMSGAVVAASGTFTRIDPIRWANGEVTIFEDADGAKYLRFENFSVVNGPNLRVVLSASAEPQSIEDVRQNNQDIDLGALRGTFGSQNYEIPANLDLTPYRSVVIISDSLNLIYSVAPI